MAVVGREITPVLPVIPCPSEGNLLFEGEIVDSHLDDEAMVALTEGLHDDAIAPSSLEMLGFGAEREVWKGQLPLLGTGGGPESEQFRRSLGRINRIKMLHQIGRKCNFQNFVRCNFASSIISL